MVISRKDRRDSTEPQYRGSCRPAPSRTRFPDAMRFVLLAPVFAVGSRPRSPATGVTGGLGLFRSHLASSACWLRQYTKLVCCLVTSWTSDRAAPGTLGLTASCVLSQHIVDIRPHDIVETMSHSVGDTFARDRQGITNSLLAQTDAPIMKYDLNQPYALRERYSPHREVPIRTQRPGGG